MSAAPRVSVIVIFLNAAAFLRDAIDSVVGQTFDRWELLLVDDGSTDGSSEIALQMSMRHPDRIHLLEHGGHENRGMSASRNLGLRHARGEYVALLDADDVWVPETLEQQTALLDGRPDVAMVYGPLLWWENWPGRPVGSGRDRVEELGVPPDTVIEPPKLVPLFLRDRAAVPSGILVRRAVAMRLGGFEEEFRGEYEDQVFCVKVCLQERVFASGRTWYRYRQHAGSAVSIGLRTGGSDAARGRFLRWMAGYIETTRVSPWSVRLALTIERWRLERPALYWHIVRAEAVLHRLQDALASRRSRTGPSPGG